MAESDGLRIEQSAETGGAVRLVLRGELDLAGVPTLRAHLQQLGGEHRLVRLDLSELRFMDSTGLGTVITAVLDARRDGWTLEIERPRHRTVQRVLEISGAGSYLWPDSAV